MKKLLFTSIGGIYCILKPSEEFSSTDIIAFLISVHFFYVMHTYVLPIVLHKTCVMATGDYSYKFIL